MEMGRLRSLAFLTGVLTEWCLIPVFMSGARRGRASMPGKPAGSLLAPA